MALYKAIASGKEHRKPYYKIAPRSDYSCRPHGGCKHCFNNRYHRHHKAFQAVKDEIKFALDNC